MHKKNYIKAFLTQLMLFIMPCNAFYEEVLLFSRIDDLWFVASTPEQALRDAVLNGTPQVLEELLKKYESVRFYIDKQDLKKRTMLHLAALVGGMTKVDILLRYGALVNVQDFQGCTPLHCASMTGSIATINRLFDAGADINALTSDGKTPLDLAYERDRLEVVGFLQGCGGKSGNC